LKATTALRAVAFGLTVNFSDSVTLPGDFKNYAFFCTMWQVLQREAPRTILPHFGHRLDFLLSFAFVRGR
jgi:hypothetical protein